MTARPPGADGVVLGPNPRMRAIFDYIETMVRESAVVPPPDALSDRVFDVFDWESGAVSAVPVAAATS